MKQAITYNENTGVMGGARPTDLSKEDVLAIALLDYRKNLPAPDYDGGAKPFDWGSISKDILNNPSATPYNFQTSQTKVLCKDGTFGYDISSSNAKYDNSKTCMNNGGRAEVKKVNPIDLINSTVGIGKYKVNKLTKIFKINPNKKDMFGDAGTDVVGTLNGGDIVEVAKLGGGGSGIRMTPYLIFNDGSYIIGYDADKVDNSTPLTLTPQTFLEKNKNNLLIAGAIVLGYFAYKKFKK